MEAKIRASSMFSGDKQRVSPAEPAMPAADAGAPAAPAGGRLPKLKIDIAAD